MEVAVCQSSKPWSSKLEALRFLSGGFVLHVLLMPGMAQIGKQSVSGVYLCACVDICYLWRYSPCSCWAGTEVPYGYNVVLHALGCLKCCFNMPELLPEPEHHCFWPVLRMCTSWFRYLCIGNYCYFGHTSVTMASIVAMADVMWVNRTILEQQLENR